MSQVPFELVASQLRAAGVTRRTNQQRGLGRSCRLGAASSMAKLTSCCSEPFSLQTSPSTLGAEVDKEGLNTFSPVLLGSPPTPSKGQPRPFKTVFGLGA